MTVQRSAWGAALAGRTGAWLSGLWFGSSAIALDTNASGRDQLPALLPPRGEIPPDFWELHLWHVVAAAFVFFGIVAIVVWWLARPRAAVTIPPVVQARAALHTLANEPETDPVLTRVSQVVRRYFSAVFELPQGELTTGEFARAVMASDRAAPELADSAVQLLRTCDEHKFAPNPPSAPLHAVAEALQLIERAETCRAQSVAGVQSSAPAAPDLDPQAGNQKPGGGL